MEMEAVERLLEWATAEGVILDGIKPQHLPGRGIGIVATRRLRADERILTVPTTLLRSLETTPLHIFAALTNASVHAILAASMCLETSAEFDIWCAVLPSREEFAANLPICWPPSLQALLPSAAQAILAQQRAKSDRDWSAVSAAFPDIERDDFLYAWNIVNSRTFYHTTPETKGLPRDDHMVLQPVADLFNHGADGCLVSFDDEEYVFTTSQEHEAGDELFIRYGAHSNDFLLVEYGFALAANQWDEARLDEYVCPLLSESQKQAPEDRDYWGKYTLDAESVCYRTMTALRLLCLDRKRWLAVLAGTRDEDLDKDVVDAKLLDVLNNFEANIARHIAMVDAATDGTQDMRDILRARWVQMKDMVVTAASSLHI
ncbi:hypothetical protein RJ55_06007 [Drechmeria coniospora]|nr:hypothetical protein RJ55_06007 [Drechmeria coniospora]